MADFVKVGTINDVAPGRPLVYDFDYETVVVFQVGESYYCVNDLCTHQEVPINDGKVEDCRVECPKHGSWFDLKTGQALNLPAVKPLPIYECRVEGEDILVAEPEDSW